ncbi:hypothetical protein ACIPSE_23215 [Streptomyces sp. NPDC090106]|uniref:hypothetical protein n=1 Tax=Streptomyces sp. NPDC090106 TaxID=3365946 RepID=UPI003814C8B5
MISTRRIAAVVGLAAGVTGLVAPMASAAPADAAAAPLSPMATLDSLSVSEIPAEHRTDLPLPSEQLAGLNRLNDLNELDQLTGLVAPVTNLVPGIEA